MKSNTCFCLKKLKEHTKDELLECAVSIVKGVSDTWENSEVLNQESSTFWKSFYLLKCCFGLRGLLYHEISKKISKQFKIKML